MLVLDEEFVLVVELLDDVVVLLEELVLVLEVMFVVDDCVELVELVVDVTRMLTYAYPSQEAGASIVHTVEQSSHSCGLGTVHSAALMPHRQVPFTTPAVPPG